MIIKITITSFNTNNFKLNFFFTDPPTYEEALGITNDNKNAETSLNTFLETQSNSVEKKPSLLPKPSKLAQSRTSEMVRNQLQQLAEIRSPNMY